MRITCSVIAGTGNFVVNWFGTWAFAGRGADEARLRPRPDREEGPVTERLSPMPGRQDALSYLLLDALAGRRSRRFSRGAAIPGSGLAHASQKSPLPLADEDGALPALAAAGINGFALGRSALTRKAISTRAGGGNMIGTLTGRTGASADAVHSTALPVINKL
jgi:hypothetical protein